MPTDGTHFSMNPQMHKLKKPAYKEEHGGTGDGMGAEHSEAAHSHHVFHKGDGKYHSVTHHADGSIEHADHESHEEAAEQQKEAFKEDVGGMHETTDGGGEGQEEAQEGAY